jgi:hypothetical protein
MLTATDTATHIIEDGVSVPVPQVHMRFVPPEASVNNSAAV